MLKGFFRRLWDFFFYLENDAERLFSEAQKNEVRKEIKRLQGESKCDLIAFVVNAGARYELAQALAAFAVTALFLGPIAVLLVFFSDFMVSSPLGLIFGVLAGTFFLATLRRIGWNKKFLRFFISDQALHRNAVAALRALLHEFELDHHPTGTFVVIGLFITERRIVLDGGKAVHYLHTRQEWRLAQAELSSHFTPRFPENLKQAIMNSASQVSTLLKKEFAALPQKRSVLTPLIIR